MPMTSSGDELSTFGHAVFMAENVPKPKNGDSFFPNLGDTPHALELLQPGDSPET